MSFNYTREPSGLAQGAPSQSVLRRGYAGKPPKPSVVALRRYPVFAVVARGGCRVVAVFLAVAFGGVCCVLAVVAVVGAWGCRPAGCLLVAALSCLAGWLLGLRPAGSPSSPSVAPCSSSLGLVARRWLLRLPSRLRLPPRLRFGGFFTAKPQNHKNTTRRLIRCASCAVVQQPKLIKGQR